MTGTGGRINLRWGRDLIHGAEENRRVWKQGVVYDSGEVLSCWLLFSQGGRKIAELMQRGEITQEEQKTKEQSVGIPWGTPILSGGWRRRNQ